jgi:Rrf2 family iron-sulfur cluster assembly transcriptional regulator
MIISKKTDYALRVILELAVSKKKLRIKDISKKQKIPFKFLQQLVLQLHSLGYIETYRGKNGGIVLVKETKDINLKDFILSFEGTLAPIGCVETKNCSEIQICVLYPIWLEVEDKIKSMLEKITIKDVVDKYLTSHSYYHI